MCTPVAGRWHALWATGPADSLSSAFAQLPRNHVHLDVEVQAPLELALDALCQVRPLLGKCTQVSKYALHTYTHNEARSHGADSNRESLATYIRIHDVGEQTVCLVHAAAQTIRPA